MTVTGTQARYELIASATPSAAQVSGGLTIGTAISTVAYTTSPDVVYSMRMEISEGDTLTMDVPSGQFTGTVEGVNQVETATVTAAAGCTSNGTVSVVVTANNITGSPLTVPVELTIATHTTAALIAGAIRTALSATAAITAKFTVGGSSASVVLTAISKLPNNATLNINIPGGLGITAAATSTNTTAGVGTSRAYRIEGTTWDAKDAEGVPLPLTAKLYSTLIKILSSTGIMTAGDGGSIIAMENGDVNLITSPTGNHPWDGSPLTFVATSGNTLLSLDIHAGT